MVIHQYLWHCFYLLDVLNSEDPWAPLRIGVFGNNSLLAQKTFVKIQIYHQSAIFNNFKQRKDYLKFTLLLYCNKHNCFLHSTESPRVTHLSIFILRKSSDLDGMSCAFLSSNCSTSCLSSIWFCTMNRQI